MTKRNTLIVLLIAIIAAIIFLYFKKDKNSSSNIEVTHNMLLLKMEEMGKLEVVKYNIQDIIEHKKSRQWLPNSKTVIVVVGEVAGCVDLSQITADDVKIVNKDSLHITLPAPQICYAKIDHARSRVYDVEYGLWETAQLVDEAYRHAENQLYAEAKKMGIDKGVKTNAVKILTPLFNAFGYSKIGIDFRLFIE